jgi:hypothetical protein
LQQSKRSLQLVQHPVRANVGNCDSVALIGNSAQRDAFALIGFAQFMPQRLVKRRREQLAFDQWGTGGNVARHGSNRLVT